MTNLKENSYISLHNISYEFKRNLPILKDISLEIYKNNILGIIGPNGGGKSTLLKLIAGSIFPTSGDISLNQAKVSLPLYQLINVSYVSQVDEKQCSLPLKVKDILSLGKSLNHTGDDQLSEVLELFELSKIQDQLFRELSGGQKQRVLLGQAMAKSPDLLILDEPTKGLDNLGQDQLLNSIEKITTGQKNTAIIIVDHNLNQVIKFSDSILCLNRTHHWHDKKELLNQKVLNSIYHCEFEHSRIHEVSKLEKIPPHHYCNHRLESNKKGCD